MKANATITQLIFINFESKLGSLVISQNSFKINILFQQRKQTKKYIPVY